MRWEKILLGLAVFLILAYLGISLYVAEQMTKETARHLEISPIFISKDYEDVSFKDGDDLTLRGWFYPSSSDKLIIMVSGVLSNRVNRDYFATHIYQELLAQGYNLLIYDHRASGESEGNRVSFGQHEASGVTQAVNWANERGFASQKVGIIATSMGTAAVLEALTSLEEVGPIVLDSPPAIMQTVASHILATEKGVPAFFHPLIYFWNKTLFGVDIAQVRPLDKVKLVPKRRFLFLHGSLDTSITPDNSQQLQAAANPESQLVLFPHGRHLETYKTDPDLYRQVVYSFLADQLNQ